VTRAVVERAIDQGIHRLLADGVHYRDMMDIRAATPDWQAWPNAWADKASEAEQRGEAALAVKAIRTAAAEFARAALYYHYGQNFLFTDLPLKKRIHDRKVAAFRKAAPLFEEPIEPVSISFEAIRMAGHFRLPRGVEKPPCVILLGGLDTTKEDYLTVNDLCVKRGLATLAFDGPGQGETQFEMLWRKDFERAVIAVIDYLETRPEIDPRRIGIIGRSMGGFFGPKTAALDKRIKAVVAWGAMYHLRNLAAVPEHTLQGFLFVSNSKSIEEAKAFYQCIDLAPYAAQITCPLLVIHGGLDAITPLDNATRMVEEVRGPVETLIFNDSIHCCHDRSHIVRPAMADFMARTL
jgi:2,6-dihydroxypseudooxynicotine hydrolase